MYLKYSWRVQICWSQIFDVTWIKQQRMVHHFKWVFFFCVFFFTPGLSCMSGRKDVRTGSAVQPSFLVLPLRTGHVIVCMGSVRNLKKYRNIALCPVSLTGDQFWLTFVHDSAEALASVTQLTQCGRCVHFCMLKMQVVKINAESDLVLMSCFWCRVCCVGCSRSRADTESLRNDNFTCLLIKFDP